MALSFSCIDPTLLAPLLALQLRPAMENGPLHFFGSAQMSTQYLPHVFFILAKDIILFSIPLAHLGIILTIWRQQMNLFLLLLIVMLLQFFLVRYQLVWYNTLFKGFYIFLNSVAMALNHDFNI